MRRVLPTHAGANDRQVDNRSMSIVDQFNVLPHRLNMIAQVFKPAPDSSVVIDLSPLASHYRACVQSVNPIFLPAWAGILTGNFVE
jgi:hypothetical protein